MYAGDVTPQEAFDALRTNPDAVLVDVRTQPELVFVGTPDLSGVGKRLVVVEWQTQPPGASNHQFVDHLKAAGVEDSMPGVLPLSFRCQIASSRNARDSRRIRRGLQRRRWL